MYEISLIVEATLFGLVYVPSYSLNRMRQKDKLAVKVASVNEP